MAESRGKVTGSGTFGGYDVTGWRYIDAASWHVKVWLAGRPSEWIGYTVTDGTFEVKMFAQAPKEAVLKLICQWEAASSTCALDERDGPTPAIPS